MEEELGTSSAIDTMTILKLESPKQKPLHDYIIMLLPTPLCDP